jgi:hypothetical protein
MPTSIVQFDNVRKHYQVGLVTVEALRGGNVLPRVLAGRTRIASSRSGLPVAWDTEAGWQSRQRLDCARFTAALRRASPREHRDWRVSREFPNAETRRPQRFAEEMFLGISPRPLRLCVKRNLPSPDTQSGAQAHALQTLARGADASEALCGEAVAQIFNLLYRRIVFCEHPTIPQPAGLAAPCRFQIGDTADCKSALRSLGWISCCRRFQARGLATRLN